MLYKEIRFCPWKKQTSVPDNQNNNNKRTNHNESRRTVRSDGRDRGREGREGRGRSRRGPQGRLAMSLSGGGPTGLGLLSVAFPSNIMTLVWRWRKKQNKNKIRIPPLTQGQLSQHHVPKVLSRMPFGRSPVGPSREPRTAAACKGLQVPFSRGEHSGTKWRRDSHTKSSDRPERWAREPVPQLPGASTSPFGN